MIVSAIIILVLSTIAIAALMESIKTAYEVSSLRSNFTEGLQMQTVIDQQILAHLNALEAALLWVGEKQDALNTCLHLHCDWQHTDANVLPL